MLRLFFLAVPACARDIKVLSYTGSGAGIEDVDNQHMCFKRDIIPGLRIRGDKNSKINAQTLKGYDVLLMPGGDDRAEESHADGDAIRAFVKAGGGYYGTCAGAFAGCENVALYSNGTAAVGSTFKLSSTHCYAYWHVGTSQNALTDEGKKTFPNQKDVVAIDHHNGPAMDAQGTAVSLGHFQGGEFSGKSSIVGDTYGAGKVILMSPHPEHDKLQNCDLVTYLAAYAAGALEFAPVPTESTLI